MKQKHNKLWNINVPSLIVVLFCEFPNIYLFIEYDFIKEWTVSQNNYSMTWL